MRIVTRISTGKIIEMQSNATAGTLIANASAQGIAADDLAEEVVTPAEYKERMNVQEPPRQLPDPSELLAAQKHVKASVLAAAILSGKTAAQARNAFKQAWDSLA